MMLEIPFVEYAGLAATSIQNSLKSKELSKNTCVCQDFFVPLQPQIVSGSSIHRNCSLVHQKKRKDKELSKRYLSRMGQQTTYKENDVTFVTSKEVPFQRWYPYAEGYSPVFVKSLIEEFAPNANLIYEPFAGTGTTLFASDFENIDSVYSEVNPLLQFLIRGKMAVLSMDAEDRLYLSQQLLDISNVIIDEANRQDEAEYLRKNYIQTFGKSVYFPEDTFSLILRLRTYIDDIYIGNSTLADLLSIAVFSCLLPTSFLKKQGDVRFREPHEMKNVQRMEDVLPIKIQEIAQDVASIEIRTQCDHHFAIANAKQIGEVELDKKISAVITSPPYLNGTNYFRNTKLELWFLNQLKSKEDLRTFRDEALTSGINDVKYEYRNLEDKIQSPLFLQTIEKLRASAYDNRIPLMAKCYFAEMLQLFGGLTRHLDKQAKVMIDIGDSIFSGVHIATDLILVEILETLGYHMNERRILRQRRSRNGEMISQVLLVLTYEPKDR